MLVTESLLCLFSVIIVTVDVAVFRDSSSKMFQEQIGEIRAKTKALEPVMTVLKNLDLFVLDNSLRETTVGQLRGHTIENKWQIYNEVS